MSIVTILVNASISVFALRMFFRLSRTKRGLMYVLCSSLIAAFLLLPLTRFLFLQMTLSFLAALVALAFRAEGSVTRRLLLAAPLVSLVIVALLIVPDVLNFVQLRSEVRLESLVSRLEPVLDRIEVPGRGAKSTPNLSEDVERRLKDAEPQGFWQTREWMLKSLHAGTEADFVIALGFGPRRMLMPKRDEIVLPDVAPIPFDAVPAAEGIGFDVTGSVQDSSDGQVLVPIPPTAELTQMHVDGAEDFLHPFRWGYIRDRAHVAGFQAHRFRQMPGSENSSLSAKEAILIPRADPPARARWRKRWAIVRIELIGLLRHPQPVAYVSSHLPQLEELSTYPTRELDDFERSALPQLRTEEDVVIDDGLNRIRLLGSLRARTSCLKCHSSARGELLGALSYELLPE